VESAGQFEVTMTDSASGLEHAKDVVFGEHSVANGCGS
jgi:hypothetical protein